MASIKEWMKLSTVVPWTMIIILAVVNVLLIRQNLQMRGRLDQFKPKVLKSGYKVQPFSAPGLHDELISVDYTGETKHVLLYFTPS